jgi:predicted SAM-dependent methyltransferase
MLRLDIGAGTNPKAGYTSVDWYEPAAITAPMWELPAESGSVEAIYSSHALEHICAAQVLPTLREWHRVLAPGGVLELRVPDLEWCVRHWLEHQDDVWALAKIFGSQEHEGNIHRTGFTREGLRRLLADAGFHITSEADDWTHAQPTLVFHAVKVEL